MGGIFQAVATMMGASPVRWSVASWQRMAIGFFMVDLLFLTGAGLLCTRAKLVRDADRN
jgi:hypothetical protein